jgi:hypothetical protein
MEPIKLKKDYRVKPFDLQIIVSETDLTLGELFEIVNQAESDFPAIAEALGMPNFHKFYSEIKKECEPDKDLEYIELYWHPDFHIKKSVRLDMSKAKISPQMSVHAIGEHYMPKNIGIKCPPNCKDHSAYALEFSPLNELAHLPIKINPIINSERMQITIFPSLYQVINSLFYELTFAGCTPEEIRESKGDIKRALDEVKELTDEDLENK